MTIRDLVVSLGAIIICAKIFISLYTHNHCYCNKNYDKQKMETLYSFELVLLKL